jgi:hypothetical protein
MGIIYFEVISLKVMKVKKVDFCHLDQRERSCVPLLKISPSGRDDMKVNGTAVK